MFIFENPNILWLLLLLLPFTALFYYNLLRKKKNLARLGAQAALMKQVPDYSKGKPHLKFFMLMTVYALLVVALANPQLGTSVKKVERKGIDVMIALDISNSMNSNDIQPSRLMRAKQAVIRILDKMESDRIGLVVFAGDAVLQLPLTTDYGAAKLFISNVQTSDLSRQGTAIGKAIRLCAENFDPKYEKDKNKAIIVISDGENHEDDAVGEAAAAAKKGIVVSTVGMGSPQGAPIPEYRNGKIVSYKKDRNGQVVITRMNKAMMQDIAKAGDGFFVEANNISSGVETVFDKLSRLDKVSFDSQNISDYETRYGYFVALALLLLLLEIFLFEKKNKVLNRARLFGSTKTGKTAVLTLCLCGAGLCGGTAPLHAQRAIPTHKGNKLYLDSSFQNAEISYLKALANDSTYYKAHYNLGNAQYRQDNFEGAVAQYQNTLQNPTLTKDERADAYHNMGNAYMKSQDYQKAIDAYVEALKNRPGRNDSRYNLAYAQKMLQQQQQQQNQQNKDNKNQDNKNQDKNQQQQQQNQQDKDKDKQQQQQQQQNSDNSRQQQSPQQQQRQKQKEQEAERILRALENQEKNTLEKIKKEEHRGKGSPVEKDW